MDPGSRRPNGRPRIFADDPDLRELYLKEARAFHNRNSSRRYNAKRVNRDEKRWRKPRTEAQKIRRSELNRKRREELAASYGLTSQQLAIYNRLLHPRHLNAMTEEDRLRIARGELKFSEWKFAKYGEPRLKNIQRARANRIEDAIARGLLTGVEIERVRHPSLKDFTADERIRMVKEWSAKDEREARRKREDAQVRGRDHHRAV